MRLVINQNSNQEQKKDNNVLNRYKARLFCTAWLAKLALMRWKSKEEYVWNGT